ncbi:MAG: DUF2254 family protein, partial [Pseudomonadota bacterium]
MAQAPYKPASWLGPIVFLSGIAIVAFGVLYGLDCYLARADARSTLFDFPPDRVADAVGSLSSVIAAVLGIVITVVSIVVQLAAAKYSQATEMFFRDRVNKVVMAFYVVSCICGVFLAFSLGEKFTPRLALGGMLLVSVIAFSIMAPYFAY